MSTVETPPKVGDKVRVTVHPWSHLRTRIVEIREPEQVERFGCPSGAVLYVMANGQWLTPREFEVIR